MLGCIHEGVLPQQGQTQFIGIECQIHLLRIPNPNRARARSLNEVTVNDRVANWCQRQRLLLQAKRQTSLGAIRQINPHRLYLLASRAIEHIIQDAFAIPKCGWHAGARANLLRPVHIGVEPVPLKPNRHQCHVNTLNPFRTIPLKSVALDATKTRCTRQKPPR